MKLDKLKAVCEAAMVIDGNTWKEAAMAGMVFNDIFSPQVVRALLDVVEAASKAQTFYLKIVDWYDTELDDKLAALDEVLTK